MSGGIRRRKDCADPARQARGPSEQRGLAGTTTEHHESLRREFPNMRSIQIFGKKVTGWQVLPVDAADFEEAALHACDLILAGDARIGKIPKERRSPGAARKRKGQLRER